MTQTAQEFWDENLYKKSPTQIMIEFAKLHATEALKYVLEEVPYGGSDSIS